MTRAQWRDETKQPIRSWFGMVGAPIIWFVHFLIVWAVSEFGCGAGFVDETTTIGGGVKIFVLVATVIGAIGTLASTFIANQIWQQYRSAPGNGGDPTEGRQRFMGFTGTLLGILFTIVVIMDALPVLFISSCGSVAGV